MRPSRVHLIAVVLSLSYVSAVPYADAQNVTLKSRPLPIIVGADSHETWTAEISYLSQSVGVDEPVILIARLGSKEVLRSVNRQRLQVARMYLHVGRGLEPPLKEEHIVTAEGERLRGAGRIEAYVRGKLFMVFVFKRGKNFAPEA